MVGAGVFGYFYGGTSLNSSSSSGNNDYSSLKSRVDALNRQLKSNSNDIPLQQDLGNAYYDLASAAQKNAPNEVQEDYNQAVKYYQNVLKTKKDINVLTDMATAAFYGGQNDLADKSFKEALAERPDFQQLTPSGDLIIPHSKHTQAGVSCTECHTGIAHGNIASKRATFVTDYDKWDEATGKSFMSDVKSIRPDMDVCINCHKVRKEPLNCSACHTTSMIPSTHKEDAFKNGGHGELATKDIKYCDSCHSYMSKDPVEVSKGNGSAFQQFLTQGNGKPVTISAGDYAKANTFCKDCHSKRPPSHSENFKQTHGVLANQNKDRCLTCHDNRVKGNSPVTNITCGSCHPSIHSKIPWKQNHPVPLSEKPQVTEFCYTCHSENSCARCHSLGK